MQSAWHSPKAWASLLLVMIIGFSADIYSKSVAFEKVADSPVLLEREQLLSNLTGLQFQSMRALLLFQADC